MVTGASSGIGRGVAVELARRGARLGLVARRTETLQEIVSEIESVGAQALAWPGDVQDANAVRAAADRFREKFGVIDVLIANAGIGSTNDAAELRAEEVASVITVNVIGAANSVAAVVPEMVAKGRGQLVVISSLAAYRGLPKSAAYCASKAAVISLAQVLAVELAQDGITVNAICPSTVPSGTNRGLAQKLGIPWESLVDGWLETQAIKRLATPEDISRAVLFLASDASALITGVALPVDAGTAVL